MNQPPRQGSHPIEEIDRFTDLYRVDRANAVQKFQMRADLEG